jgi:hypothetical protein
MISTFLSTGDTDTRGRHVFRVLDATGARLGMLSRTSPDPFAGVDHVTERPTPAETGRR